MNINEYFMVSVGVCLMKLKRQLVVQRRGAMLALTAIARDAGTDLHDRLLTFWDAMFGPVTAVSGKLNLFSFLCYYFTMKRVHTFGTYLHL